MDEADRIELIAEMARSVTDSMDMEDLIAIAYEHMFSIYESYEDNELLSAADDVLGDGWDELCISPTSQDRL
jgi:hypothetical protein